MKLASGEKNVVWSVQLPKHILFNLSCLWAAFLTTVESSFKMTIFSLHNRKNGAHNLLLVKLQCLVVHQYIQETVLSEVEDNSRIHTQSELSRHMCQHSTVVNTCRQQTMLISIQNTLNKNKEYCIGVFNFPSMLCSRWAVSERPSSRPTLHSQWPFSLYTTGKMAHKLHKHL